MLAGVVVVLALAVALGVGFTFTEAVAFDGRLASKALAPLAAAISPVSVVAPGVDFALSAAVASNVLVALEF
jgi:hypothetical protein